jgi:anti-anti-sigma factor
MPPNSDGFYQNSCPGLTVTVRFPPSGDRRTRVCLAGEVDMEASTVLAKTVDWLTELAPVSVLVDLAALTFACASLPNFVVRVHQILPDGAEIILWRPRPATEWVLRVTDMAAIATIQDGFTEPATVRSHVHL